MFPRAHTACGEWGPADEPRKANRQRAKSAHLLAHIVIGGCQEAAKDRDRALVNNDTGVLRSARSNVGKRPGRFKLRTGREW